MSIQILFTAEASTEGGRNGHVRSSDGIIDLDLRTPTSMGGTGGNYSNPEELFAAGYSACFGGAMEAISKGRDVSGSSVTAKVSFGKDGANGFGLAVELVVKVPNLSKEEAEKLVNEAHQVCPYSKATRNNIDVKLTVA